MRINGRGRVWWILGVAVVLAGASLACAFALSGADADESEGTDVAQAVGETLTAIAALPASPTPLPVESEAATDVPATDAPPTASVEPTVSGTATPRPIPTAVPPVSTTFPDSSYELAEEHIFGEYAIRIWSNANSPSDGMGFDRIATLAQQGSEPIKVEFFQALNELSGTDITGDEVAEVVIETFTGGAHCCFATHIFGLGPAPVKIMETRPSNCGGQFRDLDGDGALEFVTCDDIFAYVYCSYAASPFVTAVLGYQPGVGYAPVSPEFAIIYEADLDRLRTQAETGQPGELGEWDGSSKCSVLPYVLALLYSGQSDTAWAELARVYPYDDRAALQAEIEQMAASSQLFTP